MYTYTFVQSDYLLSCLSVPPSVCPQVSAVDLERLMVRLPNMFRQELSGVGATLEKRWKFCGFDSLGSAWHRNHAYAHTDWDTHTLSVCVGVLSPVGCIGVWDTEETALFCFIWPSGWTSILVLGHPDLDKKEEIPKFLRRVWFLMSFNFMDGWLRDTLSFNLSSLSVVQTDCSQSLILLTVCLGCKTLNINGLYVQPVKNSGKCKTYHLFWFFRNRNLMSSEVTSLFKYGTIIKVIFILLSIGLSTSYFSVHSGHVLIKRR